MSCNAHQQRREFQHICGELSFEVQRVKAEVLPYYSGLGRPGRLTCSAIERDIRDAQLVLDAKSYVQGAYRLLQRLRSYRV